MPVRLRLAPAAAKPKKKIKKLRPIIMVYYVEYNRCLGDAIGRFIRHLERCGLVVIKLPHKTLLRIERRVGEVTFAQLKRAVTSGLNPRLGSAFLSSATTGNAWVMSNRSNRRGIFVPV
ncbi:hypothetical protein [Caulobacter sp. DWR1-3-2b1]|uniref:hypothetical protein n=1 Tax=Caulobacter sp. DWR1-3-2b1 TaxID=2804670 RepID=UPI003CF954D2